MNPAAAFPSSECILCVPTATPLCVCVAEAQGQDSAAAESNRQQLVGLLDEAEQQLSKTPYLAGSAYSVADVMFTPVLFRLGMAGKTGEYLKPRPNVSQYYDRWGGRMEGRLMVVIHCPALLLWHMAGVSIPPTAVCILLLLCCCCNHRRMKQRPSFQKAFGPASSKVGWGGSWRVLWQRCITCRHYHKPPLESCICCSL